MRKLIGSLVAVVLVVGVLLAVAEFGARAYFGNLIEERAAERVENPEASFGSTPVLTTLVTRSVPQLTLTALAQGIPVEATLNEIDVSDRANITAQDLSVHLTIPDDKLLQIMQEQQSSPDTHQLVEDVAGVKAVESDAEQQTLRVELGAGTLTLIPRAKNGALDLEARGATLLGFELGDGLAGLLADAIEQKINENLDGMTLADVHIAPGGLDITARGANVPLTSNE